MIVRILPILLMLALIAGCGGGLTGERAMDYDSLVIDGWEQYNQRQYDDAYQSFCLAKKQDAERPEAYIGCGWTLLRRQESDSSAVVFRTSFDYITALEDSVDAISGLSGAYLADGENVKALDVFKKYIVSSYDDGFPLKKHDFFLEESDLEVVQAMACYRLKFYSATEKADPDNAVYHINRVLATPHEYSDPKSLMDVLLDHLESDEGDVSL